MTIYCFYISQKDFNECQGKLLIIIIILNNIIIIVLLHKCLCLHYVMICSIKVRFHRSNIQATCGVQHCWLGQVWFKQFNTNQHVEFTSVEFNSWKHFSHWTGLVQLDLACCLVLTAFPPVSGRSHCWKQQDQLDPREEHRIYRRIQKTSSFMGYTVARIILIAAIPFFACQWGEYIWLNKFYYCHYYLHVLNFPILTSHYLLW